MFHINVHIYIYECNFSVFGSLKIKFLFYRFLHNATNYGSFRRKNFGTPHQILGVIIHKEVVANCISV